ncbi:Small GTPase [Dillenia turbinata]|uniref:Small GTPase n=1 Tax=Dillenia turbinata TaxID=194707 RepID=A0AAN8UM14_9MAGN
MKREEEENKVKLPFAWLMEKLTLKGGSQNLYKSLKTRLNSKHRKMQGVNLRRRILRRVSTLRRCFRSLWHRSLICSLQNKPTGQYTQLLTQYSSLCSSNSKSITQENLNNNSNMPSVQNNNLICRGYDTDSDLVTLKICLLGDSQIGKSTFLIKYVGSEKEQRIQKLSGLNLINKTQNVKGARISFGIWEVGGDEKSEDHLAIACKDSVAILIMFDLTSRCTLNSVKWWYQQARKWNKTAIPILIGTKFDDFARAYAKAMNATVFFSSATYNINVNKVFKFITAKLFNSPWMPQRNLTIGEPIVDF